MEKISKMLIIIAFLSLGLTSCSEMTYQAEVSCDSGNTYKVGSKDAIKAESDEDAKKEAITVVKDTKHETKCETTKINKVN